MAIVSGLAACETAREAGTSTTAPSGGPMFRAKSDEAPAANVGLDADDRVFFAFDSATIDAAMVARLRHQADWMRAHPDVSFILAGHADERGTREYNLALGARRAAAVRDQLIGRGIATDRLKMTSYGKERPAVVGSTEAVWGLNRRVETLIDE